MSRSALMTLDLKSGSFVGERFQLVSCLGTGSMGVVYLGYDIASPQQLLAIKVLSLEQQFDGSKELTLARFASEVKACRSVNHQRVVRFFEFIEQPGFVAYTMEYVAGGDLEGFIRDFPTISIPRTIRLLVQMAEGVEAIHQAGIIHRDLKPANILLTPGYDVKIADFGIARTEGGKKITAPGGVVGTIDYLSPQYLENGEVTQQGDIYSLGVLGYQLITGSTPFGGAGFYKSIELKLRTDPDPPRQTHPDCPQLLNEVVMHALNRDPAQRYQTVTEILQDLLILQSACPCDEVLPVRTVKPKVEPSERIVEITDLSSFTQSSFPESSCTKSSEQQHSSVKEDIVLPRTDVLDELTRSKTVLLAHDPAWIDSSAPRRLLRSPQVLALMGLFSGIFVVLVSAHLIIGREDPSPMASMRAANQNLPRRPEPLQPVENTPNATAPSEVDGRRPVQLALNNTGEITHETTDANALEIARLAPREMSEADILAARSLSKTLHPSTDELRQRSAALAAQQAAVLRSPALDPRQKLAQESKTNEYVEFKIATPVARANSPVPPPQASAKNLATAPEQPATVVPETLSQTEQNVVAGASTLSAPDDAAAVATKESSSKSPPMAFQIRATVLYRFGELMSWPSAAFASDEAPFTMCIIGSDPFGTFLDDNLARVQSKISRKFNVLRFSTTATDKAFSTCQIAYIGNIGRRLSEELAAQAARANSTALVVTEYSGVGMVVFIMQDAKVKFELDVTKIRAAGIRVPNVLLDLALRVR